MSHPPVPPHPKFGAATRHWHYYRADGSLFCSIARWDWPNRRKEIRPVHTNGSGPEWRRPDGQAPLFAIDRISNNGRVLVVAGEKAADAAQKLFPGWAVTTSMGGEAAAAKTDWSAMSGKMVVIWPDADEPGRKYASEVAELCVRAGARSIQIVDVPADAPKGWDLADEPPPGWDLPMMVEEARDYWCASDAPAVPDRTCFGPAVDADDLPPGFPLEVWEARPWLSQLRQYAAARELDPDLLLGAVLARIAAVVPKGTAMDTGIMSARASLNMMVAGIGPTGAGKSQALATSGTVVRPPLGMDGFVDGQIGSGEGIAEAFMGAVVNDPELPKKEQRIEKRQVRHNAFLSLDEGETLHKIAAQRANTTMPTLRSAAVGAPLGAMNASVESKRHVANYHLGVFIGYQPCTVGPLLTEVAEGTPQRFLFCMAGPPLDDPDTPGCALPILDLQNRPGLVVGFDAGIRSEIRREHRRRRSLPPSMDPDWMSHAMLLRCKLAAVLCMIDKAHSGRYGDVIVDDGQWALAGLICDVSHGIVRWLVRHAKERSAEAEIDRITARAAGAQVSQIAMQRAPEVAAAVAKGIAAKVHALGKTAKHEARRMIRADKRCLFGVACDLAEANGWIVVEENHLSPGGRRPVG